MSKYDKQFKLSVINDCWAKVGGLSVVAQLQEVDEAMVRKWVAAYRQHGEQGVEKKFTSYDGHSNCRYCGHMWQKSRSHREIAAVFNIRNARRPDTADKNWPREQLLEEINELRMENAYLKKARSLGVGE